MAPTSVCLFCIVNLATKLIVLPMRNYHRGVEGHYRPGDILAKLTPT